MAANGLAGAGTKTDPTVAGASSGKHGGTTK